MKWICQETSRDVVPGDVAVAPWRRGRFTEPEKFHTDVRDSDPERFRVRILSHSFPWCSRDKKTIENNGKK